MSRRPTLSSATTALCLASALASALTLGVAPPAGAAPLPDRPPSGVDPDLTHALDIAHADLQAQKPELAARDVLNVYLARDPFTAAQRPLLASHGQALLRDAGSQLLQRGQVEPALNALDGAWLLGGRAPDPEYSKLLVDAAAKTERYNRAEALYLARRARQVNPSNQAAEQADNRLSANRYKVPALVMLIAGGVALAAGIGVVYAFPKNEMTNAMGMTVDPNQVPRIAGLATAIGGGLLVAGGSLMLRFGKPVAAPVSPVYLPAYLDTPN